jgi:hypothetical protein
MVIDMLAIVAVMRVIFFMCFLLCVLLSVSEIMSLFSLNKEPIESKEVVLNQAK